MVESDIFPRPLRITEGTTVPPENTARDDTEEVRHTLPDSIVGNFTVPAVETVKPCESLHCWHYASFQHTVLHHRDEVCCNCGLTRCISTYDEDMKAREGHGRFLP